MGTHVAGGPEFFILIAITAIVVIPIAGIWRVFEKAGEPGWAAIIPIYNFYVMARIGGVSLWWVLLAIIPYIGVFGLVRLTIGVAKSFDKGTLFGIGVGILPWIGWPLLGFRDYQYNAQA